MKSAIKNKGYFITVEGVEGAGKSSAVRFIRDQLQLMSLPCVITREPGGTAIGESIRKILLTHSDQSMDAYTELLLMFAGRAQHIAQVILPALQKGKWVVSDRFVDASFAYQGGGRGIPLSHIESLEAWVQQGLQPDVTFLLDLPVELGLERLETIKVKDRIENESKDFFERVREHYRMRAQRFPKRFHLIQADGCFSKVSSQIFSVLQSFVIEQTHV